MIHVDRNFSPGAHSKPFLTIYGTVVMLPLEWENWWTEALLSKHEVNPDFGLIPKLMNLMNLEVTCPPQRIELHRDGIPILFPVWSYCTRCDRPHRTCICIYPHL